MRTTAAFVLASLALASPAAAAWSEIRTPHFLFVGDARTGDMKRIAQRFEQFHAVMQRLLSRSAVSFAVPTVVVVFKDEAAFRPYMPVFEGKTVPVAGYAMSAPDLNYVALNAAGGDDAYPTVFHELAHLIHFNVSTNSAAWFSEGIAEYYSTFDLKSAKEVRLGLPIVPHLQLLRERLIPLSEFFAVDRTSRTYNDDRKGLFYAQSWALVHYLGATNETQGRFNEYMTLADRGVPQAEAFVQGFGMDLPTLDKNLRTYVRRLSFNYILWTMNDPLTEAQITATPLNEAAVLPHLAALLARRDRFDEAESRLTAALTKTPRSATAHAALAALRLRQNKPAEALATLKQDLEFNTFLDDYLVAAAVSRCISASAGAGQPDKSAVAMLRQHASAATEARDDVPEAWRLMAYAHLLEDEADEAERAITRAIVLAPANEYFRFTLAEAYVHKHEFEKARGTLGPLMGRGRSQDVRTQARQMMGEIVTYELEYKRATAPDPEPAKKEPEETEPERMSGEKPPPPQPSSSAPSPRHFIPVFRETAKDETRVFGKLTAVECGANGVTVVVNVGARVLRVNAPSFDQYDFITYRPELKGGVKCGPRTPPDTVFVTWRGTDTGTGELKSDAIAVEFTPLGYKQ